MVVPRESTGDGCSQQHQRRKIRAFCNRRSLGPRPLPRKITTWPRVVLQTRRLIFLVWFIRHDITSSWLDTCDVFTGLRFNTNEDDFAQWVSKVENLQQFYNGLELVLWFWCRQERNEMVKSAVLRNGWSIDVLFTCNRSEIYHYCVSLWLSYRHHDENLNAGHWLEGSWSSILRDHWIHSVGEYRVVVTTCPIWYRILSQWEPYEATMLECRT